MNRPASIVVAVFLTIIAIVQLCRVVFGVGVIVAGCEIPMWPSAIAVIVLVSLAIWLLRERSGIGK